MTRNATLNQHCLLAGNHSGLPWPPTVQHLHNVEKKHISSAVSTEHGSLKLHLQLSTKYW